MANGIFGQTIAGKNIFAQLQFENDFNVHSGNFYLLHLFPTCMFENHTHRYFPVLEPRPGRGEGESGASGERTVRRAKIWPRN